MIICKYPYRCDGCGQRLTEDDVSVVVTHNVEDRDQWEHYCGPCAWKLHWKEQTNEHENRMG